MLLPRVELVHVILSCVVLQSHKWCSFLYWIDAPWSLIASVALNYETSLIIPSPAKAKNKKCLVSSVLHDGHPKIKIKTVLLYANSCSRIRQFEVSNFILSWQLRLRNYVEEDIPDQWNGHRARGSDRLFATLLFCSVLIHWRTCHRKYSSPVWYHSRWESHDFGRSVRKPQCSFCSCLPFLFFVVSVDWSWRKIEGTDRNNI